MKRRTLSVRLLAVVLLAALSLGLVGCGGGSDDCYICGGSGYYQKKDCPGCP